MVYADNLKGGVTRSIYELNYNSSLATFSQFSYNMIIDKLLNT